MAFSVETALCGSIISDKTAATSLSTGALFNACAAGRLVVVFVATDNVSTTAGASTDITVADSKSNVYTRAAEHNGGGSAGTHVNTGIFYSVITTALTTSDTITASFSSRTAKCIYAHSVGFGAGATIAVESPTGFTVNTSTATFSLTGTSGKEYYVAAANGIEGNDAAGVGKYTLLESSSTGFSGIQAGTTGGAAGSNIHLNQPSGIRTISSGSPALSTASASTGDQVAVGVLFYEVLPGGAKPGTLVIRQAVNRAASF